MTCLQPSVLKPLSSSAHALQRRTFLSADLDQICENQGLWVDPFESEEAESPLVGALRDALRDALTEKQREVVEMYFFEGLSQNEIAQRLGVCQQVIQKRLYGAQRGSRRIGGALHRLREALLPAWESQLRGERG